VEGNKSELGVRDLTLFALTCVVSARWIPLAAHAGPTSVKLWILAAVFFVAPLTVAVAALVAKDPSAGGLYRWTRNDFGTWHGFSALGCTGSVLHSCSPLLRCSMRGWVFRC
jgi:glutamate:GABA antiporter